MMPAYAVTLQECIALLQTAMAEALASLPEELVKEHAIKNLHSPAAWNEVYHAHMGDFVEQRGMVNALFALASSVESQTILQKVLNDLEDRPVNLKLSKVRRYS